VGLGMRLVLVQRGLLGLEGPERKGEGGAEEKRLETGF